MPVLDSWYRAEGWRGTGIVQHQSRDQVSVHNRLRSNTSTEPVQISVLAWYRFPVPRQYRWTTFNQVTFRSRAGGRPCLCQHYASTATVHQILLWYWHKRGSKIYTFLPFYNRIDSLKKSITDITLRLLF